MKKTFALFVLSFTLASVMCYAQQNSATYDSGVVINGVRWATRNVDAPGTFAATPESTGMLYQWNRRVGWASTGEVTDWDDSMPAGITWERTNDPCPPGWRVPTRVELERLADTSNTWTTRNGVNGSLFGTAPNQLFLPAGYRFHNGELLVNSGGIWSSTPSLITPQLINRDRAVYLFLNSTTRARISGLFRNTAFPIRCVAEDTNVQERERDLLDDLLDMFL